MKRKTHIEIITLIQKSHSRNIWSLKHTNHHVIEHICRLSKISYSKRNPSLIFIPAWTQILSNLSLTLIYLHWNKKVLTWGPKNQKLSFKKKKGPLEKSCKTIKLKSFNRKSSNLHNIKKIDLIFFNLQDILLVYQSQRKISQPENPPILNQYWRVIRNSKINNEQ